MGAQEPTWRRWSHLPGNFLCASDLDCFHMLMHVINIKIISATKKTYIYTSLPIYIITQFTHNNILEWVITEKGGGVWRGNEPLLPPLTWSFPRDACVLGQWGPSQLAVWRGWSGHIWTFGRVTKCWWVCTPTYTHRRRHTYRHLCEKRKNKIPSPWL